MIIDNKIDIETLENLEILNSLHSKTSDFCKGALVSLDIKELSLELGTRR